MPCPYFEPQRVAPDSLHATARLPLIEEYDGLCHARPELIDAPLALRFRCCNHGYSRGSCERITSADVRSCARYNVVGRSEATLDVLCVEEQNYAPLRWQSFEYSIASDRLTVDLNDVCLAAQLLAFCRSYVRRFPG
jgi:hypothetical protein